MPDFANPFEENPDDFDGVDYVERMGPSLADKLDEHFEEVDRGNRYVHDWQFISHTYRLSKDYECENCCASFLDHTYLLHVHHRNHDKGNNEPGNLIALCVLCTSGKNTPRDDPVLLDSAYR